MNREEVWRIWRYYPAAVGRMVGFRDLKDELHGKWMQHILYGDRDYTLQAHRLSYKSSCLSVAIAMWMVLNHGKNALFMRKTAGDVEESIRQVQKVFDNEAFTVLAEMLMEQPVGLVTSNSGELTTTLYDSPRGAKQLVGMGIDGSLTGKHADFVICDDVINLKDRASRAEREKTKLAVQELRNVVTREGRIVFIGTPWHKDDAFTLVVPPNRFTCYDTGLISREKMESLRLDMSPSLFAANYELKHVASENALFDSSPVFTDDAELLRDGIAHIDASYGGRDGTAFTCARRHGDRIYLYGRLWDRHVDVVLDEILTECDRLMCAPVLCEGNADKGYLGKEIFRRGKYRKVYTEKENKYVKISTYLRKWWRNVVFLEGTDMGYINQIMDYTVDAEHDDAPDSAASIIRELDRLAW